MIDFDTAIKIGEEILAALEKVFVLIDPPAAGTGERSASPTVLHLRRSLLATHARRQLASELVAAGLTPTEAGAMVDSGAATGFANIIDWLKTNGPAIARDIAAAIPLLVSVITLFGQV
jgi:hypothetical protein